MSTVAKLRTRRLSVAYGGMNALSNVDLDIEAENVTALIGPSGCGKSTFLRALNRMHDLVPEARVSGEVLLDDTNILAPAVDVVEVRRRVGMVFQRSTPFPKSIFENVAFGLRVAGERDRHVTGERVEASLRAAALWDEVKDRLGQNALALSGGQQQRLCIARAIATRPEVLLMDEPTSSLDPMSAAQIDDLIGELRRTYTIVIVTHSLAQARRVADATAFFYLGQLIEHGATVDVLGSPVNVRTRDYVHGRIG